MKKNLKTKVAVIGAMGATVLSSANVFADGVADAAVTAAFAGAAANVVATIAVVAGAAITVWLVPLGFRFGKKIFNKVSA